MPLYATFIWILVAGAISGLVNSFLRTRPTPERKARNRDSWLARYVLPSKWRELIVSKWIVPVVVGLTVPAIIAVVTYVTRHPKPVLTNTLFILEVSKQMERKFGSSTSFQAAIARLINLAELRNSDNLSLWTSGGSCGGEGAAEVVPFAQNNAASIEDALRGLHPEGPSNLSDAFVEATGAFNDPDRFPPTVTKNVVMLTSGTDSCPGSYVRGLKQRLQEIGQNLTLKFYVIGLNVPKRAKAQLRELEEDTGINWENASGSSDLDDIVEEVEEELSLSNPATTPEASITSPVTTSGEIPEAADLTITSSTTTQIIVSNKGGEDASSLFEVEVDGSVVEDFPNGLPAGEEHAIDIPCSTNARVAVVDSSSQVAEVDEANEFEIPAAESCG